MIKGHLIASKEDIDTFLKRIEEYSGEDIRCTKHTFFRLSEKQKSFIKCEDIKGFLFGKQPILVGVQNNGCFAVFYKYKGQRCIKIILDIRQDNIDIVTFYFVGRNRIPRL